MQMSMSIPKVFFVVVDDLNPMFTYCMLLKLDWDNFKDIQIANKILILPKDLLERPN